MSKSQKQKIILAFDTLKKRVIPKNDSIVEKNIFKNMVKLVAGEGIGRIIGIISTPIITRIYLPEDFGVLAVFLSLIAIIAPFGTFRYSLAIPLPKNDITASNIVASSFLILLTFSFFLFLGLALFRDLLVTFSMEFIVAYWWLVPISILGMGIYELLSQWGIRKRAFTILAKTSVTQKVIGSFLKIVLGLVNIKPLGLLIGDLMTQMGGISSLILCFKNDIKNNGKHISKRKIKYTLKRYISFPKYRVPSQFLLAFSGNIPILYFAWKFGADVAGEIGLARTLLSIPITFIGYSVGKAFFSEIAVMGNQNGAAIYAITRTVMWKLFKISFVPFILIIMLGPFIFEVLLGSEWHQAGLYARVMSIYLMAQFVYSPISDGIFNVFEKQLSVLFIEISRFVIIVVVFLCSYWFNWDSILTVTAYSIGLALQYIISTYIVFRVLKISVII